MGCSSTAQLLSPPPAPASQIKFWAFSTQEDGGNSAGGRNITHHNTMVNQCVSE